MTIHQSPARPCFGRPAARPAVSSRLRSFLLPRLWSGGPHPLQLRKVFLAKLLPAQWVFATIVVFEPAQLHAADLSRNRLRQFRHEFDAPDALEWRKTAVQMLEDRERGLRRAFDAGRQQYIGLGDRKPDRIGARHDSGFPYGLMLQQHAFQLERADPVVGRLEDIVGAADKCEI